MLNACNDDNSKELTLHEEIAEISKSTLGDVVHFGKYQQKMLKEHITLLLAVKRKKSIIPTDTRAESLSALM